MKSWIIYCFVGVIGWVLLISFFIEEKNNNKIRLSNSTIIAEVYDIEERSDSESGINYNIHVKYTIDTNKYYMTDRFNVPYKKYNIGDKVDVLYESSNPNNAIFKDDLNSGFILLELLINLILSSCLFLGIYLFKKTKKASLS